MTDPVDVARELLKEQLVLDSTMSDFLAVGDWVEVRVDNWLDAGATTLVEKTIVGQIIILEAFAVYLRGHPNPNAVMPHRCRRLKGEERALAIAKAALRIKHKETE